MSKLSNEDRLKILKKKIEDAKKGKLALVSIRKVDKYINMETNTEEYRHKPFLASYTIEEWQSLLDRTSDLHILEVHNLPDGFTDPRKEKVKGADGKEVMKYQRFFPPKQGNANTSFAEEAKTKPEPEAKK